MDNQRKSLKSPKIDKWSFCQECHGICKPGNKYCRDVKCRVQAYWRRRLEVEIKAEVAGEAQKSFARQVLSDIDSALVMLAEVKTFLQDFLKKPL